MPLQSCVKSMGEGGDGKGEPKSVYILQEKKNSMTRFQQVV